MTFYTVTDNVIVIDPRRGHRRPCRGELVMTGLTAITGRHMITAFTAGDYRVMAQDATIDKLRMIYTRCAGPGHRGMTGTTIFSRRNMIGLLPLGRTTGKVTTGAGATHLGVIHVETRHR